MRTLQLAWDGEAFWPLSSQRSQAKQAYGPGEIVAFAEAKDRSSPSHRHYFAALREAWVNLPEGYAERFATDEHLRKWALIRTGFCHARSIVCRTRAEARAIAAIVRSNDAYALVSIEGRTIWHLTAMSQSTRAMDHATFQASKRAVLELLADILGVAPQALMLAGAEPAA
ncbi:MAG TPA: hypothetical protein VKT30_13340 [Caulobacteraceae bacterium]|nr:hypothetical protein [Caulobacteraceae bacterium]